MGVAINPSRFWEESNVLRILSASGNSASGDMNTLLPSAKWQGEDFLREVVEVIHCANGYTKCSVCVRWCQLKVGRT